jgi:hypothetical protein
VAHDLPHTFLFTNFGKLRPQTPEEARVTHNETAGAPEGVAAAKSLGDLSHLVFAPRDAWTGELMFLDQWTSAEGIQRFFADPQVQAGGARLFTEYDPVVWRPDHGFLAYHIAEPLGRTERIVGVLRGTVTSMEQAQTAMNDLWRARVNEARKFGLATHEVFVRLAPPDSPAASEIIGIDTWSNPDGLHQIYDDPTFMQALGGVFASPPSKWRLQRPAGNWIEW